MRHWNPFKSVEITITKHYFYPTYEALKQYLYLLLCMAWIIFTLPMRHWNQLENLWNFAKTTNFYPTYEALKQNFEKGYTVSCPHFYPTYEALKPSKSNALANRKADFYPTYEALKLPDKVGPSWFKFIFTLPMRHWNNLDRVGLFLLIVWFLPYLWGIETS